MQKGHQDMRRDVDGGHRGHEKKTVHSHQHHHAHIDIMLLGHSSEVREKFPRVGKWEGK